jgi:hypothetical protein
MKGVKFTEQTSSVAICLFTIYLVYGFLYIPFVEYLSCLVVGGIAYGVSKSYEISLLAILLSSFAFQLTKSRKEPFIVEGAPLVMAEPGLTNTRTMKHSVQGFSSPLTEGFDTSTNPTGVIDVTNTSVEHSTTGQSAPPVSAPAPAVTTEAPPAVISEQGVPAVTQPAESFQDNGGLFKLGKIPTDEKGGFYIDSGTSILNALKTLKPDQIQAMTQDTKQLIETQKSLMNMLQSFKPMMSEGKEMMATFQEMFSPTSTAPGTASGALNAAKNAMN